MNNRRKDAIARGTGRSLGVFVLLITVNLTAGCIELGLFTPIGGNGTSIVDGTDLVPGDGSTQPLVVALSVSNPTPQINEEVTLRCRVTSGDNAGALFAFTASPQPATRLNTNQTTGRASFIVTESDINISFRFTCNATTDAGESAASSAQLVTPTGL